MNFLGFLFLSLTSFATPNMQPMFYAKNSTEALLKFDFYVEMESAAEPSEKKALNQANQQVAYLFGTFDRQTRRSVPKRNHKINLREILPLNGNIWKISYSYEGTIQTESQDEVYSFDLPLNPDEIYKKSLLQNSNGQLSYPCGDEVHFQQIYFWYFFNPRGFGCPLHEGTDYVRLSGHLNYLENTHETYPEYNRLVNNGETQVDFFYGMNDPSLTNDPLKSSDINSYNYVKMRNYLLKMDYKVTLINGGSAGRLFAEQFTKMTPAGLLKINMFFGGTDTYSGKYFRQAWIESLATAAIVIYAGHSGLGSYLNVDEIEKHSGLKLFLPQDRYQIFFMNGCSSYPYYGDSYFELKKTNTDPNGTKNLDIITNGLSTYFTSIDPSNQAVFKAIEKWALTGERTSYQKMIDNADSNNLIGINGDEDNTY